MGVATIQAKAMQTFMKTLLSELRRTVSAEDVNTKVRRDSAQTKAKGDAIVDKAVYAASEGLYANFQQLANEFMISQSVFGGTGKKDGSDYARKRQYLKSFCDIDFRNTDTGAVIGSDANGKAGQTYTASSVVPEDGNGYYTLVSGRGLGQNGYYDYKGARLFLLSDAGSNYFNQQVRKDYTTTLSLKDNAGNGNIGYVYFTNTDQNGQQTKTAYSVTDFMRGLIHDYHFKGALDLAEKAYGISLSDQDTAIHDIYIGFYYQDRGAEAVTSTQWGSALPGDDKHRAIFIRFNLYYFNKIAVSYDGEIHPYGNMDRVLAHEMVHAVMDAQASAVYGQLQDALPTYIKEGLAELVHGGDDREYDILAIMNDPDFSVFSRQSYDNLEKQNSGKGTEVAYGLSYALLRYLMKQLRSDASAGVVPGVNIYQNGTPNDSSDDQLVLSNAFSGKLYLNNYGGKYHSVNASLMNKSVGLVGTDGNDYIAGSSGGGMIAGLGGDDYIHLTGGVNNLYYFEGSGNDTIHGYQSGRDYFSFENLTINGLQRSQDNLLVYYGKKNEKINILGAYNANVRINGSLMALQDRKLYIYGSVGWLHMDNYAGYTHWVIGSHNKEYEHITGTNGNDTISVGQHDGNDVAGLGGDDDIWLTTGRTTLWYIPGSGNDTVHGYKSNKDLFNMGTVNFTGLKRSGKDLLIQYDKQSHITVKDAMDKSVLITGSSMELHDRILYVKGNVGWLHMDNYADYTHRIIGSHNREREHISGTNGNDIISVGQYDGNDVAGRGGNDDIWLTTGRTTLWYIPGSGNDTVHGYKSNKDLFNMGTVNFTGLKRSGKDLLIQYDKQSHITVKDAMDKSVLITGSSMELHDRILYVKGNVGWLHMDNYADYTHRIIGSHNREREHISGTNGNDIISVGQYDGNDVAGRGGNDDIWLTTGRTTLWYYTGSGNDTVHGYKSGKDVFQLGDARLNSWYLQGQDVIMQYGTRGETIRVTDAVGKRILVTDNTGKWSSFTASQKSVSGASSMMPSKNSLSYLYDNNIVSSGSFVGSLSATVQSQTNRMMVAGAH